MKNNSRNTTSSKELRKPIYIELDTDSPNSMEWVAINSSHDLPLSTTEIATAEEKGKIDLVKMQTCKELLLKGKSINAIQKSTGISRNTVYSYLKLFDDSTHDALAEVQPKYSRSTVESNFLFLSLLSISSLGTHSTLLIFYAVLLLSLIVGVVAYTKSYKLKLEREAYEEERKRLHYFYLLMLDFKFNKNLVVVACEKEAAYYRERSKDYNNKNREVRRIDRRSDFSVSAHHRAIEKDIEIYAEAEAYNIKKFENKKEAYIKKLKEEGKLDYFNFKLRNTEQFHRSRACLLGITKKIRDKPHPIRGHKYDNNFSPN